VACFPTLASNPMRKTVSGLPGYQDAALWFVTLPLTTRLSCTMKCGLVVSVLFRRARSVLFTLDRTITVRCNNSSTHTISTRNSHHVPQAQYWLTPMLTSTYTVRTPGQCQARTCLTNVAVPADQKTQSFISHRMTPERVSPITLL
jgi:hypothetical protein